MMIITMIIIIETYLPPLVMTNYQLSLKITVSTLKIMVLPRTTVLIAYRICTCFGVVRSDRVIPWETFFGTYSTVRTTHIIIYLFFCIFIIVFFSSIFVFSFLLSHTGSRKTVQFSIFHFPFSVLLFFRFSSPLIFPKFPSIPLNSP